ncbi:MAG: 2-dehydropantoate 2-reductase [Syntrophomonadaceae bacterium]|nr:2-dehydropantoate 2-reductase [Syntrophomonadaceae bacterium]
MKVLVVGLGALGTVFSCLLKEQGHQVAGLDQETVVNSVKNFGVRVTGIWGEHAVYLDNLYTDAEQIVDRDFDLIIMTVKAFNTAQVSAQVCRLMGPHTYMILAQNGYGNYQAAAENIPEDKLILGRVIFGAETLEMGTSKVTVIADDVILGSPRKLIDNQLLSEFARFFTEAGIPTRVSDQVMQYMWGKIIYNSALNSLGAILEVNYGQLAEMEYSRTLMDCIIREIFAVMAAMQEPTLWPNADSYLQDFYGKMVPTTAAHHASMLQDIQRGRRTEIEALNGAIVELGKRFGVPTPVNEVITQLVKAKETLNSSFSIL